MNPIMRRGIAVAAGLCLAGVCAATPASANEQAQGTFYWQGLFTGSGTITDPIIGNCYTFAFYASSGDNQTNAVATTYLDGNCTLFGVDTNPGDRTSSILFGGVVFHR